MKVAIIKDDALDYDRNAPFHPPERYPEYPFEDTGTENQCYSGVRELFHKVGMDRNNYDRYRNNSYNQYVMLEHHNKERNQ